MTLFITGSAHFMIAIFPPRLARPWQRVRRRVCAGRTMKLGCTWLGIGAHDSVRQAGQFNAALAHRQAFTMACPKGLAWCNGFINDENPEMLAEGVLP